MRKVSYSTLIINNNSRIVHCIAYLFRLVHIVESQIWSHRAENTRDNTASCKQVLKRTLDLGRKAARWANAINQRRNVVQRIASTSTTSKKVLCPRESPLARRERATAPAAIHVGREVLYHFCENNLRESYHLYTVRIHHKINYFTITSHLT